MNLALKLLCVGKEELYAEFWRNKVVRREVIIKKWSHTASGVDKRVKVGSR